MSTRNTNRGGEAECGTAVGSVVYRDAAKAQAMFIEYRIQDLEDVVATQDKETSVQKLLKQALLQAEATVIENTEVDLHLFHYVRTLGAFVDFDIVMTNMERARQVNTELLCWFLVTVQRMVARLAVMSDSPKRQALYRTALDINAVLMARIRHPVMNMWKGVADWAEDDYCDMYLRKGREGR